MESVAAAAFDRQRRVIQVTDIGRTRALQAWRRMDFQNLDQSWAQVSPAIVQQASAAQLRLAKTSDPYTARVARATEDFTPARSAIVPEAFTGIDGDGRDVSGILYGAVTTTKEAVGSGLGAARSMEAGATYLAAIFKTVVADMSRSADLVSAAGKGYTHYVRVTNGAACSRCAALAGISSGEDAFLRHVSCQCTAVPVSTTVRDKLPAGLNASPQEYFDSLSEPEQDTVFGKAGAQAIRDGADVTTVVTARRGAAGMGYSHRLPNSPSAHNVMVKTTIGHTAQGAPVQVYTTTEGTTARGRFAKQRTAIGSTDRIRLMPESIMEIAGDNLPLRQAFLRDAGYLQYIPPHGYDPAGKWVQDIQAMKVHDRQLVGHALQRYSGLNLS